MSLAQTLQAYISQRYLCWNHDSEISLWHFFLSFFIKNSAQWFASCALNEESFSLDDYSSSKSSWLADAAIQ